MFSNKAQPPTAMREPRAPISHGLRSSPEPSAAGDRDLVVDRPTTMEDKITSGIVYAVFLIIFLVLLRWTVVNLQ